MQTSLFRVITEVLVVDKLIDGKESRAEEKEASPRSTTQRVDVLEFHEGDLQN